MRHAKVLAISATILVLGMGAAAAESTEEKQLLDQSGDPANYTLLRVDRNGGDNCGDAPTIGDPAYVDSGDTTGYTDDWGPDVGGYGQDGEDQAYLIVLGAADTLDVTVTPNDAGFDLSAYIIGDSDCANYSAAVLAGVDSGFAGDPEVFSYAAGPGTYVVIVDSYLPGEVGPFTIEVASNVPVELISLSVE